MRHLHTTWNAAKYLFVLACLTAGILPTWHANAAGLWPEPANLRVRVTNAASALAHATDSVMFELAGTAALHCAPDVTGAAVSGANDVEIRMHWPIIGCNPARATGFAVAVDVAAVTGVALPRGRVYPVSIRTAEGDLLAFRLFDTTPMHRGIQPESGFWWPTANDALASPVSVGTGVGIEVQGSQLAVNVFGFDDSGAATWYFGTAQQIGRVATAQLVGLQQGDPLLAPMGRQPQARAGLRLELLFLSPTMARAWLVSDVDGRDQLVREFMLTRRTFDLRGSFTTQLAGRWVLVSDGEAAPRQFQWWAQVGRGEGRTQLGGSDGSVLECRLDPATGAAAACSLSVNGVVEAEFDQVGFDRLGGRGNDGAAVQLLRVPPPH